MTARRAAGIGLAALALAIAFAAVRAALAGASSPAAIGASRAAAIGASRAAAIGASWAAAFGRALPFLFVCRFPLAIGLTLVALPPVALLAARSLLGNLFSLRPREVALVAFLASLAAWMVMVTLAIFVHYGPARFGVAPIAAPAWLAAWRVPLFALLAAPTVAAAVWRSPPRRASAAAALGGIAAAVALLFATAAFHWTLRDPARPAADLLVPSEARLFAPLPAIRSLAAPAAARLPPSSPASKRLPGYLVGAGRIGPGHLLATVYFLLSAAVYGAAFALFRPGRRLLPALAYVLQLLVVLGWALPGISFWLDRYRLPVVPLLAVLSFLASRVFDTDHYYWIETPSAPALPAAAAPARLAIPALAALPTAAPRPAEAFVAAERAHAREAEAAPGEQPVVVVAASGGGSAAALWTAQALTGLQRELGEGFTRSIRFLSAVSGGSVGALFFLDRFTERGAPAAADLPGIVEAAGRQSLDAAAWGLAYPDLWRVLGLRWGDLALDRGWAMEQVWRRDLRHPRSTLGDWRAAVAAGWLPAAVFNATTVETGERFLFSPLDLQGWKARRFAEVYRGYDVLAVTAARLSASFPWVSPVARALRRDRRQPARGPDLPGFHLGDGGYYDNFGVVTAIDWLRSLSPEQVDEVRRRGLLLVLLRAFPESAAAPAPPEARRAWAYSLLGPILALMRARGTTQSFRNSVDLNLLNEIWNAAGIRHHIALFTPGGASPLTWKLTEADKAKILAAWDEPANRAELARVKGFCGGVG